ncbi:MAG: site-specific DNA-methyltransferase [Leptospiraceae bacterium]|nr:site-specific DNA-methyltransferase [Leptospiraceae bacterium]
MEASLKTYTEELDSFRNKKFPILKGEFWTAKQRQAHSLHEISYRACFKPQLPKFFIQKFSNEGDVVYDPFAGRGTTILEAALLRRKVIANDINPLSQIFIKPRLNPPLLEEVKRRLEEIDYRKQLKSEIDLSMFYHPLTLSEILNLREYLRKRVNDKKADHVDLWIQMVATNRLTGHSKGFFSVYTLPPNQATSPERQRKINTQRNQKPEYKNTKELILKKSKQLLRNLTEHERKKLKEISKTAWILNQDASKTSEIPNDAIQLTVTSPPFLDVVHYANDNWLRCWFNYLNVKEIQKNITHTPILSSWEEKMQMVFHELFRITKKSGYVAFEVGEIKKGEIKLEESVIKLGLNSGFECEGVFINEQNFTKTANIWGVKNNQLGTNTNRIVLFQKRA